MTSPTVDRFAHSLPVVLEAENDIRIALEGYDADVDLAWRTGGPIVLDVFATRDWVATVRQTPFGLLWESYFEVSTASAGVDQQVIEPVVKGRRRGAALEATRPIALRPCVHLIDHPELPGRASLVACGPTVVNEEFDLRLVLGKSRAAAEEKRRRFKVVGTKRRR